MPRKPRYTLHNMSRLTSNAMFFYRLCSKAVISCFIRVSAVLALYIVSVRLVNPINFLQSLPQSQPATAPVLLIPMVQRLWPIHFVYFETSLHFLQFCIPTAVPLLLWLRG